MISTPSLENWNVMKADKNDKCYKYWQALMSVFVAFILFLPTLAVSQTVKTTKQNASLTPSVFEGKNTKNGLLIEGKTLELGTDLPIENALIHVVIDDKIIESTHSKKNGLFEIYLPQTHENQGFTLFFLSEGMERQKLYFKNYALLSNSQLFVSMQKANAKDLIKLHGIVVDSNNEPLPFVTLELKGTLRRTSTDIDGYFAFKLSSKEIDNQAIEIVASMIGMNTESVKIKPSEIGNEIKIQMKEDGTILECIKIYSSCGKPPLVQTTAKRSFKYRLKNLFRKKSRD